MKGLLKIPLRLVGLAFMLTLPFVKCAQQGAPATHGPEVFVEVRPEIWRWYLYGYEPHEQIPDMTVLALEKAPWASQLFTPPFVRVDVNVQLPTKDDLVFVNGYSQLRDERGKGCPNAARYIKSGVAVDNAEKYAVMRNGAQCALATKPVTVTLDVLSRGKEITDMGRAVAWQIRRVACTCHSNDAVGLELLGCHAPPEAPTGYSFLQNYDYMRYGQGFASSDLSFARNPKKGKAARERAKPRRRKRQGHSKRRRRDASESVGALQPQQPIPKANDALLQQLNAAMEEKMPDQAALRAESLERKQKTEKEKLEREKQKAEKEKEEQKKSVRGGVEAGRYQEMPKIFAEQIIKEAEDQGGGRQYVPKAKAPELEDLEMDRGDKLDIKRPTVPQPRCLGSEKLLARMWIRDIARDILLDLGASPKEIADLG